MEKSDRTIRALLIALIALDVTISIVVFAWPSLWFQVFHGVPYVDPQNLLRRMGANWTAFALFQIIALVRWRREPYWLAVVAGVRFSDIFTDITCYALAADTTPFAALTLIPMSPINFFIGFYLLNQYRRRLSSGSIP